MTTTNRAGHVIFDDLMPKPTSSTLFLLTTDALGSNELQKLYGSIDIQEADGLKLWKVLDKTNLKLDPSVLNRVLLSREFDSMKREANEFSG